MIYMVIYLFSAIVLKINVCLEFFFSLLVIRYHIVATDDFITQAYLFIHSYLGEINCSVRCRIVPLFPCFHWIYYIFAWLFASTYLPHTKLEQTRHNNRFNYGIYLCYCLQCYANNKMHWNRSTQICFKWY